MVQVKGLINDFLSLIYPRNCAACGELLFRHEEFICNYCFVNLPKSNFHLNNDNELSRVFEGRLKLVGIGSYYIFEKSGKVQKLLHSIKYKGNKELAVHLGEAYAKSLIENTEFSKADIIIPVPLHPKKKKQRGFNQSEEFAKGLSSVFNIPVKHNIIRISITQTQTRKKRFERWENVQDKFELVDPQELINKRIILVDDVITTGATIESCCVKLNEIENVSLAVLSLAYASKT